MLEKVGLTRNAALFIQRMREKKFVASRHKCLPHALHFFDVLKYLLPAPFERIIQTKLCDQTTLMNGRVTRIHAINVNQIVVRILDVIFEKVVHRAG